MKVERISYQKTFPLAPYVNEKIGVEIQLDGDSPEQALYNAKKIVEDWHKQSNPNLVYEEPPYEKLIPSRQEQNEKDKADLEFAQFKMEIDAMVALGRGGHYIITWMKNNGWFLAVDAKQYVKSKLPNISL